LGRKLSLPREAFLIERAWLSTRKGILDGEQRELTRGGGGRLTTKPTTSRLGAKKSDRPPPRESNDTCAENSEKEKPDYPMPGHAREGTNTEEKSSVLRTSKGRGLTHRTGKGALGFMKRGNRASTEKVKIRTREKKKDAPLGGHCRGKRRR